MSCDFASLTTGGIRALKPYEPGKPIEDLERELGISDSLKLASNENPLGPSPLAVDAINKAAATIELYPDGNGFALKRAIADLHNVPPEYVTLGNGSNELLELIARAFLTVGVEAIFSEHAFAVYPIVTQAVGATARISKANPADHEMPYGTDLSAMAANITDKTRVIFVANPNNPTGTWLSAAELRAFVERVPPTVIIVVDEAYAEYVQEDDYPNTIAWVKDFPNLVVTRTFSKIYGLAGVRIGYGVSSPEVADLLNRVRQPFNTNSLAQAAAFAALADKKHVEHSVSTNVAGLRQLTEACQSRGLSYIPSVGNFLSIDVGRSALPIYQAMLHEAVIVRPIANYGLPNHLRVTIGNAEQNQRFLRALDKVLAL